MKLANENGHCPNRRSLKGIYAFPVVLEPKDLPDNYKVLPVT